MAVWGEWAAHWKGGGGGQGGRPGAEFEGWGRDGVGGGGEKKKRREKRWVKQGWGWGNVRSQFSVFLFSILLSVSVCRLSLLAFPSKGTTGEAGRVAVVEHTNDTLEVACDWQDPRGEGGGGGALHRAGTLLARG